MERQSAKKMGGCQGGLTLAGVHSQAGGKNESIRAALPSSKSCSLEGRGFRVL